MSTHTIQTEIKVRFTFPGLAEGEHETAHPTVEISYDYFIGPHAPGLAFRAAKYIARDGLDDDPVRLQELAEQWLFGDGYDYACDCAELDLAAQKHAHLEGSRDQ